MTPSRRYTDVMMLRVSERERDATAQQLQWAFAEGRLGPEELDSRLERALTASTRGDLELVTADLTAPDELVVLRSTGGTLRRSGDWQVPRRLRVDSEYGGARLDLSRALIEHPVVEIDLRLAHGSAVVLLPKGASANVDGVTTVWGSTKAKVASRPTTGKPHVIVTGELQYGKMKVRYSR